MNGSLTYYCVLCNEDILKQLFEQHRAKHLENPFVSYPKTLNELEDRSNKYTKAQSVLTIT